MTRENKRGLKENKGFVMSLIGYGKGNPEIAKREGQIIHFKAKKGNFVCVDIYIEIGEGAKKIIVSKDYLEYAISSNHTTVNAKSGAMEIEIRETVEIFTSKSHKERCKWGTLELHIKAKENINQEPEFPATIGTFSGCGIGALKSAKVKGVDQLWKKVDCPEATNWGYAVNYARVGSITGWPSEVTSWPPK